MTRRRRGVWYGAFVWYGPFAAPPARWAVALEDRAHLAYVRTLPCCASSIGSCSGAVTAHHHRAGVGLGRRAHDHLTIPLCARHHSDWHLRTGVFEGWTRARLYAWTDAEIARVVERRASVPSWF